jgi:hypothetical protein
MRFSERYQKALVTVAMGFRTEEDIKKNGLYRFSKYEKLDLIKYINELFKQKNNLLLVLIFNNRKTYIILKKLTYFMFDFD